MFNFNQNAMRRLKSLLIMLLLSINIMYAQQINITGMVTDKKLNEPIIGASVIVKGSTNGTITDFDGNFTIKAAEKSILKVSYIGYAAQIIPVSKKDFYPVVMKQDTEVLDEVVVTALAESDD